MKKILSVFLLIASYSVNAEENYIEIGITDVGSWSSLPSCCVGFDGQPLPDIVDNSNRSRKFISFYKELNDGFYLLGSYTKTKTNELVYSYDTNTVCFGGHPCNGQSFVTSKYNLEEDVSTLGIGYEYLLKNYDLYAELSAYRYTKSSHPLSFGWLLGHSEVISMGSALKKNGSMYKLGLIKELSPDVDIDISYGSYQNITINNHKHSNKSIKLIKDFDDKFSLVFNYEKDGITGYTPLKRTNRSLSLRTKF